MDVDPLEVDRTTAQALVPLQIGLSTRQVNTQVIRAEISASATHGSRESAVRLVIFCLIPSEPEDEPTTVVSQFGIRFDKGSDTVYGFFDRGGVDEVDGGSGFTLLEDMRVSVSPAGGAGFSVPRSTLMEATRVLVLTTREGESVRV